MLTQAAGRAGRGDTPGIVLIQTINPDHYAIRCAAAQNYEMFYAKEIEFRRMMWYPPFGALANVVVRAGARRGGAGAQRSSGPPAPTRSGGRQGAGTRARRGGAPEERVSLSDAAQNLQPRAAERDSAPNCGGLPPPNTGRPASLLIDVDPMTLL